MKNSLVFASNIFFILVFMIKEYSSFSKINSDDITNISIERSLDLRNNLMEASTKIKIKANNYNPIDVYRYLLMRNTTNNLLHIEAYMIINDDSLDYDYDSSSLIKLNLTHVNHMPSIDHLSFIDISFKNDPLNYNEERLILILEYYQYQLDLLPKEILLVESQYALYHGTYNLVSNYPSLSQSTSFELPVYDGNPDILTYTKTDSSINKGKLVYTLPNKVPPFTIYPISIHFRIDTALYEFPLSEKVVDVSHWGSINVEEKIEILNKGARLKGEYGRVDLGRGGRSSIKGLEGRLPLRSNSLWYRDEIGNISSSQGERMYDDVKMGLTFRFPLVGGWENSFSIGYSLPSKFHIKDYKNDTYRLEINYGNSFDNVKSNLYVMTINLPENVNVIDVFLPTDEDYEVTIGKTYSILDSYGRVSVEVRMKNAFYIHNDMNIEILYTYSSVWMIYKPVLLSIFIFMILLLVILLKRVSFTFENK